MTPYQPPGGRTPQILSGPARFNTGCIITFENEAGALLTVHHTGTLADSVGDACHDALSADPTFRAVCYSTPQTIYADLYGRKERARRGGGHTMDTPEIAAFAGASQLAMLHPRLSRRSR